MFAVTALFVYIIINTYVTTSLVIALIIIISALSFDIRNKTRSFIFIILLVLIIYILHISGIFVQLFDFLIEFFKGTAAHSKMKDFKTIYLTGEIGRTTNIAGRSNLHEKSWVAFFENILTGGSSPVGGHSSLVDRLGGMGLLAFVPFVMIIAYHIRMMLQIIRDSEQRIFYFLGLGAAFTILYQKGLFGQEGWLFMMVLMPGLIITFRSIEIAKRNKKLNPLKKEI